MEQKWWLDSQTVKGALISIVPTVVIFLKLFNVEVQNSEVDTIVSGLAGILGIIGTVTTIIGRFKAHNAVVQLKQPTE